MKKYIILSALALAVLSCNPRGRTKLSTNVVVSEDNDIVNTMVIDGCEYITWRRWEGEYSSYSSGIVHKGNCKNHKHE